jgi:hypothetical protein
MAMEFYFAVRGDDDLPPKGVEVARKGFDKFGVDHGQLSLADVREDDPRYRQAVHQRDRLRKKINSGACCIDVPPNRQFRVEVERGKLMMFPASDLARAKLEGLGERVMRGLKLRFKEAEQIIKVLSLTARRERDRQQYEFALDEIGYAQTNMNAMEQTLTARSRKIAGVLPSS